MNEVRRSLHTVQVGNKDIHLKFEEEYAPGNPDQPIAVRVIGPNGLQSTSVDGMLKMLEVAPRYLLSEEKEERSGSAASSESASAGTLLPANATALPETASSRISKDAFDLIDGTSTLPPTGAESPLSSGKSSQSRQAQGVSYRPPSGVVEDTDEDLGDLTRDFKDGREHGARIRKFEKEHPYLWKEYDEALENESGEPNSVIEDI